MKPNQLHALVNVAQMGDPFLEQIPLGILVELKEGAIYIMEQGLAQPRSKGTGWELTDKGRAMFAAVCALQLPEQVWMVRRAFAKEGAAS